LSDPLPARIEIRTEVRDHSSKQCRHLTGRPIERLLACIEPRQAQQIADQPFHAERMPGNRLEKAARFVRVRDPVKECFDVSTNGGQRRAKLVRDIGHEVAADPVGFPEVGDVVEDEHGTAPCGGGDRRASRDERGIGPTAERQLTRIARQPVQGAVDLCRDVRVPRHLEVVPPFRWIVDLEHAPGRTVDQLQPPLRRDHQHTLAHPIEDRFHARPIGLALCRAAADLAHRIVEDSGYQTDFVRTVVAGRP
jgi:hypothetical protein